MALIGQRPEGGRGAGGPEHFVAQLSKHLADQRRDLVVVLDEQDPTLSDRNGIGGVPGAALSEPGALRGSGRIEQDVQESPSWAQRRFAARQPAGRDAV